jgi:hypothetical protein
MEDLSNYWTYTTIYANIYLSQGEHYFFTCTGDDNETDDSEFTDYCALFDGALAMTYPVTDQVKLNIQPLYCKNKSQMVLSSNEDEVVAFESMCE